MNDAARLVRDTLRIAALAALAGLLAAGGADAQEAKVTLSGSQEIPPVTTAGSGSGTVSVAADRTITGSVTVAGMKPTVAHIHEAPAGNNGPIVIPLAKTGDNVWSVPPNTKLTDAQFASFKSGNLYFNVHSDAFKAGEIRGQIRP